jgi:hypothetical protein
MGEIKFSKAWTQIHNSQRSILNVIQMVPFLEAQDFPLLHSIQTSFGAHSAFYTMGTGVKQLEHGTDH